jgi:3-hydroxyisobutyrate dehydrogenase
MGAATGRLAVLLGGDAEVVDRCRTAFSAFADKVVHFGSAGAGTRAKVARNLVTFASYAATGEALRLAEAAGLDLAALGDVVRHSDAVTGGPGAIMLRSVTAPLPPDDGLRTPFEHALALGEKDLDLALAMAHDLDVDMPLTAVARERLAAALGLEG